MHSKVMLETITEHEQNPVLPKFSTTMPKIQAIPATYSQDNVEKNPTHK